MPKDMRTEKHHQNDFAILGRTYGFRHLLSLERNQYYIQGFTACQAKDNNFPAFSGHFLKAPRVPRYRAAVQISAQIFRWARRSLAGILCVFQEASTQAGGKSAGELCGGVGIAVPSQNYSCLLAFIFTPGPMVEAATQDLIYWPLAAAGLALMMAPMRAE